MFRQWVALQNGQSDNLGELCGYMRISVTILGPGEKAFQHDMQEVGKNTLCAVCAAAALWCAVRCVMCAVWCVLCAVWYCMLIQV